MGFGWKNAVDMDDVIFRKLASQLASLIQPFQYQVA